MGDNAPVDLPAAAPSSEMLEAEAAPSPVCEAPAQTRTPVQPTLTSPSEELRSGAKAPMPAGSTTQLTGSPTGW